MCEKESSCRGKRFESAFVLFGSDHHLLQQLSTLAQWRAAYLGKRMPDNDEAASIAFDQIARRRIKKCKNCPVRRDCPMKMKVIKTSKIRNVIIPNMTIRIEMTNK